MRKNIKRVNINYEFYDNESKINLVYLHGWGQNIQMMMPIAKPFIKKYNVLIIDLPGFGDSAEPNEVWSIEDYSDMVYELTKELKMNNPILIGHSFGGKISLNVATNYKTKKLVLLACPYRVENKKLTTKQKIFKVLKKVPGLNKLESTIKKYVGSTDYRNASEMMRKILVKHVNYDLTDKLKYIKCPTLLIWGTNDAAVPIADGEELENIIPNCGLVKYEGCTHYAYLENLVQTVRVLDNFIGSDKK